MGAFSRGSMGVQTGGGGCPRGRRRRHHEVEAGGTGARAGTRRGCSGGRHADPATAATDPSATRRCREPHTPRSRRTHPASEGRPRRLLAATRDEHDDRHGRAEEQDAGSAGSTSVPFGDPLRDSRVRRDAQARRSRPPGPNGVTHDARTRRLPRRSGSGEAAGPGRGRPRARRARGRPDPRKKLPWMFAQTSTRIGTAQRRAGWRRRSVTRTRTAANRPSRSAGVAAKGDGNHGKRREREHGGEADADAPASAQRVDEAERDRGEQGSEQEQARPATNAGRPLRTGSGRPTAG